MSPNDQQNVTDRSAPDPGRVPDASDASTVRRKSNNLVTLGSAAVVAIYAAGYLRTRSAAEAIAAEHVGRRAAAPAPAVAILPEVVSPTPTPVSPAQAAPLTLRVAEKPAATKKAAATSVQKAPVADSTAVPVRADSSVIVAPATTPVPSPSPTSPTPSTVPAPPTSPADTSRPTTTTPASDTATKPEKPRPLYKDGVYFGYGTSRHGDIEASVEIKDGRISFAYISRCLTQYPCSWITILPGQVVARQSANVDFISGATQSSDAFYYAVLQALSKAK